MANPTTISGLPDASGALTGAERVPLDDLVVGVTKDATTLQIAQTLPDATPTSRGAMTAAQALKLSDAALIAQLRNARKVYVSLQGNDSNNGTSVAEPLRTLGAASLAAQPGDVVFLEPGTYVEPVLPIRWKYDVTVFGAGLRSTVVQPAPGQEFNDIFKVDSGFWCWGLSFAGHQADATRQAWAIDFDELANNTARGATGLGAYIQKSPYIQNCTSITAEDDAGTAGSTSTGNTGGGIRVDGNKCAVNTPIRSMVVDSYTQVNLGGPGCLVLNDGYAQLVSFFGTFCEYHVRTESGGQVNLSGGGTSDFGVYGLMADGYSPRPVFTGASRIVSYGAARIDRLVTINASTETFSATAHGLSANDQVVFSASQGTLPAPLVSGTTYFIRATGLTADTFTVSTTAGGGALDITGATTGIYSVVRQGATQVDVISFSSNRFGGTVSRPSAGQLMFPQLVFPRNATTGVAEAKTFTYTKTGANTLTFTEAAAPSGPEHDYVSGGTVVISGTSYAVTASTYNKTTGLVTITTATALPGVNGSTGSAIVSGLAFICQTSSAYIVTSSIPIDASGNPVANDSGSRAGYRVLFYSGTNGGLRDALRVGQILDFRQRSQISAPGHTFEYVGAGMNYNALPWFGGVPIPANKIVEVNNGRVYSSNTDELGNFAVGTQFRVDGTTGSVTINTDQFDLSGLNFIGPFSRNGGISTVGEQLREISNNASLIASTGAADGNTAPTQFAVKTYTDNKFLQGLTVTAGQPISVSDTSTVDGQGFQTRNRNVSLSLNVANGLARLDGSGFIPASIIGTFTSPVVISAGTAAAPSLTFTGDLNTGVFSSGADVFDVTTGGTAKVRVDNTTAPLKEIFSSVYYPIATQVDIGTDPNQIPLNQYLGTMAFQDSAGVNIDQATINTATISGGTATLSSAAVTAFSNVPLLTGGGLKFPPTQVANADPNTLDDYEEGTFTPTVIGNPTSGTATYTAQVGVYTKIGRLVTASFGITYTGGTGAGTLRVGGFPFLSVNTTNNYLLGSIAIGSIPAPAGSQVYCQIIPNAAEVWIQSFPLSGGNGSGIPYDGAGDIIGTITYQTA